ncbi:MAG TPA: universal stress protein [Acidimicrobiales bacterium]|nr:universal stress protein [Acidimicrobiales bacterium]
MTTNERQGRIVVGVDGSASALGALEWAAGQAELTGSPLEALITWHWPMSYGYPMPLPPNFQPYDEAVKVLGEAIAKVRSAHSDLQIETKIVEGHPAQALVEASKDARLLVVGNRGHGEMTGLLIGSVSEYCVAHSHCPVLVFRA